MALIFLCGLMGAGKSTVGPRLAERLAVPFVDLDQEIEREAGATVAELFAREGESGFRQREARAVARVTGLSAAVVALGGGAVASEDNRARLLGKGRLIWLDAPTATLLSRLGSTASRPLLANDPQAAIERLRGERAAAYAQAHLRIDTASLSVDDVVGRVVDWLRT